MSTSRILSSSKLFVWPPYTIKFLFLNCVQQFIADCPQFSSIKFLINLSSYHIKWPIIYAFLFNFQLFSMHMVLVNIMSQSDYVRGLCARHIFAIEALSDIATVWLIAYYHFNDLFIPSFHAIKEVGSAFLQSWENFLIDHSLSF